MRRTHPLARSVAAALTAVLATAGCQPGDGSDAGTPDRTADAGEAPADVHAAPSPGTAASLGVTNAREPLPGLVTAGQPTEDQLDALREAGYHRFVSLRPSDERGAGWEEAHLAGSGDAFERIPVAGADDLTREAVEALDRMLASSGDEPTVLYCASSNRVGALLALRAHWLQGVPRDEALALGRSAGLTSLEPAVARLLDGDGS